MHILKSKALMIVVQTFTFLLKIFNDIQCILEKFYKFKFWPSKANWWQITNVKQIFYICFVRHTSFDNIHNFRFLQYHFKAHICHENWVIINKRIGDTVVWISIATVKPFNSCTSKGWFQPLYFSHIPETLLFYFQTVICRGPITHILTCCAFYLLLWVN